jgi:hypothetical protein
MLAFLRLSRAVVSGPISAFWFQRFSFCLWPRLPISAFCFLNFSFSAKPSVRCRKVSFGRTDTGPVRYYGWSSNKMRGVRQRGLPPELVVRRPGGSRHRRQ